jgi:addiction module RelE/StbE family toxin
MKILQTPTFKKQVKKLYSNQKIELDNAVYEIIKTPDIGQMKKGDLTGVRVYKFRVINQLYLLAYQINDYQLELLSLGTHENFYRDLK